MSDQPNPLAVLRDKVRELIRRQPANDEIWMLEAVLGWIDELVPPVVAPKETPMSDTPTVAITSIAMNYVEIRTTSDNRVHIGKAQPSTASGFVSWPDGMRSSIDGMPLNADEQTELDGLLARIAERVRERF